MQRIALKAPYLIFVGDEARVTYAKTGRGIVDWRRDACAGSTWAMTCPPTLGLRA